MKAPLFALRLNELLDRPFDFSIQAALMILVPIHLTQLSCNAKRSNARINPPGDIESSIQVLRMKDKLFPVGLNELLGCPSIETTYLQIFGFEANLLRNTSEHLRANLFFVMEGEHHIRPART
jgi:hypothetical protein